MVETKLFAHDQHQLELRLSFEIRPDRAAQDYQVEAWFFIPRTLGIDADNYGFADFDRDTGAFVRLTTPRVPLADLAQDSRYLDLSGPTEEARVRRIKVLACVMRGAIKRSELPPEDFLPALAAALERFRSAAPTKPSAREFSAWQAADEFVHLVAEEASTARMPRPEAATLAIACYRHRLDQGYTSFMRRGGENEELLRARRLAKRAVSSVLWLEVSRKESGALWRNVAGMAAAATAMAFAIGSTLYATAHYDMFSVAFVGIAVASYVVKDRIKDIGKAVLGRRLKATIADHTVVVKDRESGDRLGTVKETFRVMAEAPDDIAALRLSAHESALAADARPEVVLHWRKQVHLSSAKLAAHPLGSGGLTDLLRFNLQRLTTRMDGPYEDRAVVDPETLRLITQRCADVHHVNVLLKLVSEQETRVERVRVVLDQRGIKRVESLRPC